MMRPVIYDVAVSIDGFISGPRGDISNFAHDGPVVEDYLGRLSGYGTAIMGRKTYEFGYGFGLEPGQNPYSNMDTIVFSRTCAVPPDSDVKVTGADAGPTVDALRNRSGGPIYLCGGGAFAGSLLRLGLIDVIRLKRAPIVLGGGVRLFGDATGSPTLHHIETRHYGDGYLFQEFAVA